MENLRLTYGFRNPILGYTVVIDIRNRFPVKMLILYLTNQLLHQMLSLRHSKTFIESKNNALKLAIERLRHQIHEITRPYWRHISR